MIGFWQRVRWWLVDLLVDGDAVIMNMENVKGCGFRGRINTHVVVRGCVFRADRDCDHIVRAARRAASPRPTMLELDSSGTRLTFYDNSLYGHPRGDTTGFLLYG